MLPAEGDTGNHGLHPEVADEWGKDSVEGIQELVRVSCHQEVTKLGAGSCESEAHVVKGERVGLGDIAEVELRLRQGEQEGPFRHDDSLAEVSAEIRGDAEDDIDALVGRL